MSTQSWYWRDLRGTVHCTDYIVTSSSVLYLTQYPVYWALYTLLCTVQTFQCSVHWREAYCNGTLGQKWSDPLDTGIAIRVPISRGGRAGGGRGGGSSPVLFGHLMLLYKCPTLGHRGGDSFYHIEKSETDQQHFVKEKERRKEECTDYPAFICLWFLKLCHTICELQNVLFHTSYCTIYYTAHNEPERWLLPIGTKPKNTWL